MLPIGSKAAPPQLFTNKKPRTTNAGLY